MSASYEAIFPSLRTVKPAYAPPGQYEAPGSADAAPSSDSFAHDVMEVLNPLQHIPIVSIIYRQMTGDKIGPMERIAGDTLYGGLIGLASSVANVAFEKLTGKDFGDTALAMLGIGQDKPTAVAANAPATQSAPPRVADAAPASLIPVSTKSSSSLPVQVPAQSVIGNSTPIVSIKRNGAVSDLASPAQSPAAMTATNDTNANALLASLNRRGISPAAVALPVSPATPLMPAVSGTSLPNDTNAAALMTSLNHDGIGTDLGLRAMYAYRKSLALPADGASAAPTLH